MTHIGTHSGSLRLLGRVLNNPLLAGAKSRHYYLAHINIEFRIGMDWIPEGREHRIRIYCDAYSPIRAKERDDEWWWCEYTPLIASMKVRNARSPWQRVAARPSFASFAYGVPREEYLKELMWLYETQYENLALPGMVQAGAGQRPFFLVSGAHDKGFPWGSGETFWDVLLVVGDGNGGYHRYAITDRDKLNGLTRALVAATTEPKVGVA